MTYIPHPQATEGGQDKMIVSDPEVRQLLLRILRELRIIKVHASILTDEEIILEV